MSIYANLHLYTEKEITSKTYIALFSPLSVILCNYLTLTNWSSSPRTICSKPEESRQVFWMVVSRKLIWNFNIRPISHLFPSFLNLSCSGSPCFLHLSLFPYSFSVSFDPATKHKHIHTHFLSFIILLISPLPPFHFFSFCCLFCGWGIRAGLCVLLKNLMDRLPFGILQVGDHF